MQPSGREVRGSDDELALWPATANCGPVFQGRDNLLARSLRCDRAGDLRHTLSGKIEDPTGRPDVEK